MAAVLGGQGGSVNVGGALTDIKGFQITVNAGEKDITVLGSGGWADFRHVLKSWGGSFDMISYPGDITGSTLAGSFITSSETGSNILSGSVLVTDVSPNVSFDEIVSWKVSFKGRKTMTLA